MPIGRIPLRSLKATLRLIIGVAALSLLALGGSEQPAAKATGSYAFGAENSWIRIQNIGSADAEVTLSYFNEAGLVAGQDGCPSTYCPILYPGSGWTFFQRDNPSLPAGFQGSAVISTDQPIVAILAKDVFRWDKFSIGGDTLTTGPGSHRVYLPATAKHDGPNADWSGRFVIQNLSDTVQACVQITYLSVYTDSEVGWEPYRAPANGAAPQNPVAGCPYGGMPIAARGSLFRWPDTMAVPDHFTGSVRIDLYKNGANQGPERQFISVAADSWNANSASFGSYRGFDESELGREIVLPLMDRQVGPANSYSTRFTIVNKDPTRPAEITLRFDGYDLNYGTFVSKSNKFTVRGSRLCVQDLDEVDCLADGDNLPFNFVGTARLSSSQPIAVVVDRGTFLNDGFTDYRGIRPEDGATRVLLPVLNKNYGPVPGYANGWNSWFRVMVADGGFANVTVTYYGLDLPGGSASYNVAVDREFTVFQFEEWMLPDGFAGTAIIASDRPIVALADIYTDVFQGDPDMVYNGVPLR